MKYREVEFKYRAQIGLEAFASLCKELSEKAESRFYQASGFDHFYESQKDPGAFARHRVEPGKFNQLSFKRKLAEKNNYVRTEHNINLSIDTKEDQIKALCSEFGFLYNTSIFKNCFIYKFELYTLVYYICYDASMKELDRFIEIEMDEDHAWGTEEAALQALQETEAAHAERLQVSAQARIKRSLFEMFRKEKK